MPRIFPLSRTKSWSPGNPTRLPISNGNTGWSKFRLLLWKNYKIQTRHHVQTFMEIFLPLLFTIVLVIVRDIVKSEYVTQPTIYEAIDLSVRPFVITYSCQELYYTPSTPIIDELMEKVRQNFFIFSNSEYNFTGFATEEQLIKSYDSVAQRSNTFLQNSTSSNHDPTVSILAGVVFDDVTAYNGKIFPTNIKYTLRFPAQQRSEFDLISERFGIKPAWFTEIAFPLFQYLGPRARDSPVGGMPGYFAEGFLYLQNAIDTTLSKMLLQATGNETAIAEHEKYILKLQRFPYKPYIEDKYLFALQGWLPLLTVLSFIYPVLNTTKSIVYEKEKRLKESMKMMGLPNYLHWSAWFVKAFSFLLLSILIMTILIKARFSAKQDLAVLSYVSPTVLFTIFLVFIFQLICYCFMISTFASTANFGATLAGVLWFIFFAPYFFIQPRYNILSRGTKLMSCFLTNAPIALACQILCMFEGTGAGLQWSEMFEGSGPDDNFSMADCLIMMLVNAGAYLLIALYVEAVWPGEYGVPLPWNFPFKKWYWTNGVRNPNEDSFDVSSTRPQIQVKSDLFEAEPDGYAGVQIKGLTKDFHTGKLAVNNVSINMYQNQVTALLGHNGAGKTTTMSMLTGLFPPTSGTALINDFDICTDIKKVRSSLGICPQHDVLFDDLTVEEHLRFYSLMKGYPKELVETEINRMLVALGLADKRKAQAHTLSGGMKRKLSVGIALCAGSKVVLLDEPTSGMDPSARRSTWDLIQNEKKGRTVLLSTHFMEEADLLGDRIAIMADGELQCCGSSLFLKKRYGGGYHLIIVKDDSCVVENITNLLKKRVPDVEIGQDIGAELSYSLPDNKASLFPEMFEELEGRKTELGIASYGASITTMEEVFIRVGREAERKITAEYLKNNPGASQTEIAVLTGGDGLVEAKPHENGVHVNMESPDAHSPNDSNTNLYTTIKRRNSGMILTLQQLKAMILKKSIYAVRNRILLLGQMVIPVIYLTIVLIVMKTLPGLVDPPAHFLSLSRYEMLGKTLTTVHCENNSRICENYKSYVSGQNFLLEEVHNQTFIKHMLDAEENDLVRVNFRYIIGYEETPSTEFPGKQEVIGFFNNQPFHSPPLAFNYIVNAVLKTFTTHTIEISNHPFPYTTLDGLKSTGTLYTMGFQVGYNLTFGMSFVAASFIVFLIQERESRSKHLQFVSGLNFFVFWIANYVIDIICYIISIIPIVLCLVAFQVEDFLSFEMMSYFVILLLAYGFSAIPFMYLWSYAFTIAASGFTRIAMFNVFTGMASMLTVVILQIPDLHLGKVADMMNSILLVFPNYALGMGTVQLSTNLLLNKQCQHEFQFLEDVCSIEIQNVEVENYCCTKVQTNFFAWHVSGIGKNIAYLLTLGFISAVILLIFDSKILKHLKLKSKQTVKGTKDEEELDENKLEHLAVDDSDVMEENERIRSTNLTTLFESNNLILRDLTKYYGKFLAVDKLNLGVKRGQTFGLLGINGAGKTTSFKMLTGDIPISSGDAFVYKYSVRHDVKNVHNNLGYCPQFDGIIGEMTGRETLYMIARLRGIYEEDIPGVTNKLANDLIFTRYLDKLVKNYSGGNKRKLSTAMALVGNPPIVFLDEPTTGMDPVARRHLWNAISIVRDSGTSIVLTSHSMEECEALCSRLAIMVNGKFRCLGSPQHLKNKFGEGYTLIAQTAPTGIGENFSRAKLESGRRRSSSIMLRKVQVGQKWETDLEGLRNFIEQSFPGANLKDIHPGYVHYHILPSVDISWGAMFRQMEIAKEKFNLDAYSVGQTSLEQVFLNFAKAQINID